MQQKMQKLVIAGASLLVGALGFSSILAYAQTSATPTNTPAAVISSGSTATSAVDTPESANDPADTGKAHGHAPLGGDGVVVSINGTSIVIGEESDEGGASYTVDASKATVTNNGASASLSDIKVGDKIFVEGAVNGTSVTATSVSLGHHGGHMEKANDTDGNAASETSEGTSASDASDQ